MRDSAEHTYAIQQTVVAALADHPDWARALEEMIAWEEAHPWQDQWDGWTWQAVHTRPQVCTQMVALGLLDVVYQSRSTTHYRLVDRAAIREALEMIRADAPAPGGAVAPDDLFSLVVGHERAKVLLRYSLLADSPVHVLLTGPPGTAKTLLLQDIARLPGAELYAGSTTTKAGLVGLLLTRRPRYLVIDEIDKMADADMTPLLNLMEGGVVTQLQFRKQERIHLDCRVYATANDTRRLSRPILSRFLCVDIPAYTPAEFIQVAEQVLVAREGLGPQMAHLIATEVVRYSTDIRDAVRVARMARGRPQEVPMIVRAMFPGGGRLTVLRPDRKPPAGGG